MGNAPSGKASWSGDVFGLALYNEAMSESEALESYQRWTEGEKGRSRNNKGETALYVFNEGTGTRVENALDDNAPLMIPEHPAFKKEVLGRPMFNKYYRASYARDGVINVLGFIPFGFCSCLWMVRTGRWTRGQVVLMAVALGALVSLTIELVQVLIPVRDSSAMDLACNTFGALTGAGLALAAYRPFGELGATPSQGPARALGEPEPVERGEA